MPYSISRSLIPLYYLSGRKRTWSIKDILDKISWVSLWAVDGGAVQWRCRGRVFPAWVV